MDFEKLYQYQIWADNKISELLSSLTEDEYGRTIMLYASLKDKLSHILETNEFWLSRISGKILIEFPNYDDLKLENALTLWKEQDTKLSSLATEIPETYSYKTTSGKEFTNNSNDTLFHLINHTTYHRGQLITFLRLLGKNVVDTDFVYFLRA